MIPVSPEERVCNAIGLVRQPGEICGDLRLVREEELHGPLYFLWRHRSKFHEKTVPFSAWSHYAIVSRASNAPGSRPA